MTHTQPVSMQRMSGFSLIEIMIVVVIVAILSSIAYPSYLRHIQRSIQVETQGQIMELSGALEAHRAKNFSYQGATITALAPSLANSEHYTSGLALSNSDQAYTITSTPSSSRMTGTPVLKYTSAGEASWDQ